MNASHEVIVRRFRAGETAIDIGAALGLTAERVRRVLKAKHVGSLRRGRQRRRPDFQSRPDGEYCRCAYCVRLGYGEDSWHPATTEFWRTVEGRLHFGQCKACLADVAERKRGVVGARVEAVQLPSTVDAMVIAEIARRPMTVMQVSAALQMAKETVRDALLSMEATGHVRRSGHRRDGSRGPLSDLWVAA